MAGGPSTPALAQAVSSAGGLGFVAAGYRSVEALREDMAAVSSGRFGVNVFVPGPAGVDETAVASYLASLGPDAGEPRYDDDAWEGKLELLRSSPPAVVSFTFGCAPSDVV